MLLLLMCGEVDGRGIVARSTTIHYEMLSRDNTDEGEQAEEQQLCGDMPFAGLFRGNAIKHEMHATLTVCQSKYNEHILVSVKVN